MVVCAKFAFFGENFDSQITKLETVFLVYVSIIIFEPENYRELHTTLLLSKVAERLIVVIKGCPLGGVERERGDQEQGGESYRWELYLSPGRGGKGEGGSCARRGELSLGIVLVPWDGWKGRGVIMRKEGRAITRNCTCPLGCVEMERGDHAQGGESSLRVPKPAQPPDN